MRTTVQNEVLEVQGDAASLRDFRTGQNGLTSEEVRTKAEMEGRTSLVELKGWRAEKQPEAQNSIAKPG